MTIVTRFPPSPTGFMHIGNARTALFNYLFARANGGKFVVRIEDTDRKRHSEEAIQVILDGLEWLGLDYDGEITSQFANQQRHTEVAQKLLNEGKAYKCYCTPEELEEMRTTARAEGRTVFYDRSWRDRDESEAPEGVEPVIRIKAPLDGAGTIHDKVQGKVSVNNDQIDDFIILRSDGSPTYMLAVVVDDHDAGITHVIRGDDHLNNTFRQNVIIDALGWEQPIYAHLPLIHGPDGKKFSKRHGAESVEDYRKMGFLPAAMSNYLLRLGWSHGDDEIIPRDKALEWFNLDNIGKSAANFDFTKLESLNAHYIKEITPEKLLETALPFYKERHNIEPDQEAQKRIIAGIDELKDRAKTILNFVDDSVFYARNIPFEYDEKAQNNLTLETRPVLEALIAKFKSLDDFTGDAIKQSCFDVAEELMNGKMGKVGMPLRAAVTGTTASPSIFEACAILGLNETCDRIEAAIKTI